MNTKMNNDMIKFIQSIKKKKLINIECALEKKWNRTYGYIRLNLEDSSIDISNIQESIPLFGELEDVAVFRIYNNTGKSLKEAFDLIEDYNPIKIDINEKIINVEIISEKVNKNNEIMEFDMCIVIKTEKHTYLLSRENWFDEFIYLNIDEEFNKIYPIEKDLEVWDTDNIKIERIVNQI